MRAHLKVAPHLSQRAHSSTVPLRRYYSSACLFGNATSLEEKSGQQGIALALAVMSRQTTIPCHSERVFCVPESLGDAPFARRISTIASCRSPILHRESCTVRIRGNPRGSEVRGQCEQQERQVESKRGHGYSFEMTGEILPR